MSDETAESQTQVGNNEKSLNDWPKNIVDWDGPDDPKNPMNWSRKKKLGITVLLGLVTMGSSFASSSFSPTFDAVSMEFGVSTEVVTLSLSLYVLGFAFGPLVSLSFLHPKFSIPGLLFWSNNLVSCVRMLIIRTVGIRPNIRALRKKDINPPSIPCLRHLPHRRCDGREYPDHHVVSVLRGLVCFGTTFKRSGCNGGSLE